MTTSSRRSTAFRFLAVALFVAVWCLGLVCVAALPKWLSLPLVVLGIVMVRVIAALGPTLHIRFQPDHPQEGNR
jgi:hypothetical protein